MPTDLSLPGSSGLPSFKKTRHLPGGIGDVSFDVTGQPGSAVLAALATNGPFPGGRIDLESLSVKVSSDRDVPVGGVKGSVNFSGTASTYQGIAVLDEPADVIALLVRDQINDDLAKGLALEKAGHRYLLLRWGYDLQAAAKGAVGLGAGPKITFGAEGKRLGAYAVVRQIPSDTPSRDAIAALFDSWMLPSQFEQLDDLAPGTTIVAEIDGSLAVKLGAQYRLRLQLDPGGRHAGDAGGRYRPEDRARRVRELRLRSQRPVCAGVDALAEGAAAAPAAVPAESEGAEPGVLGQSYGAGKLWRTAAQLRRVPAGRLRPAHGPGAQGTGEVDRSQPRSSPISSPA